MYCIYSNFPDAALAFDLKKKGMIIREAGILERRYCALNAFKSGLKMCFQK